MIDLINSLLRKVIDLVAWVTRWSGGGPEGPKRVQNSVLAAAWMQFARKVAVAAEKWGTTNCGGESNGSGFIIYMILGLRV